MKTLRRIAIALWLGLKWAPAKAWGFLAAFFPEVAKIVAAVVAVVESPVIATVAAVVGIAAGIAAVIALTTSDAGQPAQAPVQDRPASESDASSTSEQQPSPSPPQGHDSEICTYPARPMTDDWIDPSEEVDSLILTEFGSSDLEPRPPNLAKWNQDAGGDALHPVLELGDDHAIVGAWLVKLKQPIKGVHLTPLVKAMLLADSKAGKGHGCQYMEIVANRALQPTGLSGVDELDFGEQWYLREDGSDFVGAWEVINRKMVAKGRVMKPVTVAVFDLFLNPHGLIAQFMPVDVEPPHHRNAITTIAPITPYARYKDHGDTVASIMFWPNNPDLPGVGTLRFSPVGTQTFKYMPVPLPQAREWYLADALQEVSGVYVSKIAIDPEPRVDHPTQAQVMTIALESPVPESTRRLSQGNYWSRVLRAVRSRPNPPIVVIAGGNKIDMRNILADPAGLTALASRSFVDDPDDMKLIWGYDTGQAGTDRPVQIATPGTRIQLSYMSDDGIPMIGGSGEGASTSTALLSGAVAMMLAVNPKLSEYDVSQILRSSSRKSASSVDNIVRVPLLNARAAVASALPWTCKLCPDSKLVEPGSQTIAGRL